MKLRRFLLLAGVLLIFFACYVHMNRRFDRLARYPYEDEEVRDLIYRNLNDEEIDYIIEYSLSPDIFIRYIRTPGFSVYRSQYYNALSSVRGDLTNAEIVHYVNEIISHTDKVDEAISYLGSHSLEETLMAFREAE